MKNDDPFGRRKFLRQGTSLLGTVALAHAFGGPTRLTALPAAIKRSKADFDKVVAGLDAKSRQFVTIGRKDCQFLHLMIEIARAKNVLELGTGYGFATVWMGLALEATDGKVVSVEILADRVQAARKHVAEAGLSERVTFHEGDAHQLLPEIKGPFDFVLLNADKDGCADYFKKLYPMKLLPGALLLAFGAISRQEKMKDYLDMIAKHPDFDTVGLSATLEDGFSVSWRRRP